MRCEMADTIKKIKNKKNKKNIGLLDSKTRFVSQGDGTCQQ
jgi:hypothetical protein